VHVTAYVSLLRGVNLGPANQVSMPALKQVYVDLGLGAVTTYIRSGNVVFTSDATPDALRKRIESAMADVLGMRVDVVVRTHDDLAAVVSRNPFAGVDTSHLAVVFLSAVVPDELAERLSGEDFGTDQYAADGRHIYLHLPNGFGRSKLATRMSALRSPVVGTVRNWRTVDRLLALSKAP
jgi:uncharacterized protein (DUF1697 family)